MEIAKIIWGVWETWGLPGMVLLILFGMVHAVMILRGIRDDLKIIGGRLSTHEAKDEDVQKELAVQLGKIEGRFEGMPLKGR